MANPNVFASLMQAPRSVMDYMADMDRRDIAQAQLQGLNRQNELAAITAQGQMEQARQAQAERNALARFAQLHAGNEDAFLQALDASGMPGLMTQADARRKTKAEIALKAAQTGEATAKAGQANAAAGKSAQETTDAEWKARLTKHKQAVADISALDSADEARLSIQQAAQAGTIDAFAADRLLRSIPQDPAQFGQWQRKLLLSLMDAKDREAATRAPKPTATMQEYEAAVAQGFKGTMFDYQAQLKRAGASKTSVEVNTGQKGYENESKLRNDFKSEPIYKDFADMAQAHKQIKAGLSAANPIGDVAAATKIMKLLDPGSVVRESELGIAMAAAGKFDRLTNFVQMQISGQRLTPTQRKEFSALADDLMEAAGQAYNAKRSEYAALGQRYGLDQSSLGAEFKSSRGKSAAVSGEKPAASGGTVLKFDAQGNPVK